MNLDSLADQHVRIAYANFDNAKRIRAWAKRHGATARLTAYTREAYEGSVVIPSLWNENAQVARDKATELRARLQEWKVTA